MQNLDEPYFASCMLNERRQSQKATYLPSPPLPIYVKGTDGGDGLGKSTDTESRTRFKGAVGRENGEGVLMDSFFLW